MKNFGLILFTVLFISSYNAFSCFDSGDSLGLLPPNNLKVPVNAIYKNDMSKRLFKTLIDNVARAYRPYFNDYGGRLVLKNKWHDSTVNAYAEKKGNKFIVTMFGGLARHPLVTADAFSLVVCHEFGHHLGGAPRIKVVKQGWLVSNEGQADYFAAQKCLKNIFNDDDNVSIMSKVVVPDTVTTKCEESYRNDNEIAICQRVAMAGLSLAKLFNRADNEKRPVRFETPDTSVIWSTWILHPKPQCRLDTYLQGALCNKDPGYFVNFEDHRVGYCNSDDTDFVGLRPRCWFNPERY